MKVLNEDDESLLEKLEEELSVSVGSAESNPRNRSIFQERHVNLQAPRSEKISASEAKQRLSSLVAPTSREDQGASLLLPAGMHAEGAGKQSGDELQPLDQIEEFVMSGSKGQGEDLGEEEDEEEDEEC
eukprot:764279-Hanusia_phi.AAC.1